MKMPTKWALLFVLPIFVVTIVLVGLLALTPLGGAGRAIVIGIVLIEIALTVGVVILFTELHVSIDTQTLTVGFRAFRERIPIERIVACTPVTYRWIEWGGYGIRINRNGKMYNVPGDGGHAVQVTLDSGRRIYFSSLDPAAACAAINGTRSGSQ
jgi:hypothetical protein